MVLHETTTNHQMSSALLNNWHVRDVFMGKVGDVSFNPKLDHRFGESVLL